MEQGRFRSFAKLNLHLQVIGKRGDGYHELRTVFQTIDLGDELAVEIAPRGEVDLIVEGPVGTAPGGGPENLVHRAATAFRERWAPGLGVRLRLEKRVPVGAGLGGGSGDAAATLLALRELLGRPATVAELFEPASDLGADVPYFLVGGTALGVGRGDEIVPLPDLPKEECWLLLAPIAVSTRAVFESLPAVVARPLAPAVRALALGIQPALPLDLAGWNDLQQHVLERHPALLDVYNSALACGASPVRLSGSGAALFARLEEPAAAALRRRLPPEVRMLRTLTLSRAEVAARFRVV